MSFRIIKGEKIRERRGTRSLKDIAEAVGVTRSALWQWETGKGKPADKHVPVLLQALSCNYEDISEPVSMALEQ
jgi:transcriptional regulator with XRE-family HTH domain